MSEKIFLRSTGFEDIDIEPFSLVTRKIFPKYTELIQMSNQNKVCKIKKIDKDRYLNLITGEVCNFVHKENRSQSIDYLAQSIKKVKDLINYNFQGSNNEKWVTLTYKDGINNPMRDTKKLYRDVEVWVKRMRRFYKDFGKMEYIICIEPQENGALHCHCLLKWEKEVYLNPPDLSRLWGHGFVHANNKKDIENLGGYLSAHLGNVRQSKENISNLKKKGFKGIHEYTKICKENGNEKRFIKGGRLHFYPSGINLFRRSRGIFYPPVDVVKKEVAIKEGNLKKAYYRSEFIICDENLNRISKKTILQYKNSKNDFE